MGSCFWNFLLVTSLSSIKMKIENEFDLNDSGFIDDVKCENEVEEISAYEKIRLDNIKERQKMFDKLLMKDAKESCTNSISSRKYEKRKVGKVNKSIKRKSVRIA